ncbi:hypothetical protein, partial [Vibrio sp. 10N.239.312.D08]|uniref:hypothetical protein n=1 Tax=Vibrio sp. 10N.239.312.D08 TaxID=3229978 RepID=UPI00354FB2DA
MSALNNRSIQNSLGVISNALAGGGIALNLCEANVAFCYEDSPKAATRHSSVNIPNADFSDKGNMEIAEGQAVHESLHHIFSDPEAKSMLTKDAFSGFRNNVFDSAEDAYIEDMGQRKWRGIRKVLNRRLVHYKRKCFFQKTEELEVIELIEQYIYCFMSVERNNATPLDSLYSQAKFRMIMELGFENFDHLNELLPNGLKTTSSLENVEFAESIANWLKGLIPNQPQQQQQQQPEPNKDKQGDTSDGENQQGDTGESQQGESGEDKQGDTSDGENQQGDTGES